MKKTIIFTLCATLFFIALSVASSNGGSKTDPLVTKSKVDEILNENFYPYVSEKLDNIAPNNEFLASMYANDKINKVGFVLNDKISVDTGDKITIYQGNVSVSGSGTLIDITTGTEIVNPNSLNVSKSYIVAENSSFIIKTTSLTSKIEVNGSYTYTNDYTPLYEKYAYALSSLGLFRGTDYGFELARPATRLESIVMLIRLLGEEDDALSYTGSNPFTDVPDWAFKYVSYAYSKGYTKGISNKLFGSNNYTTNNDYYTFVLRVLNYNENVDFKWSDASTKAREIGLISSSFKDSNTFYRDQIVFVSYSALNQATKDKNQSLKDVLIANKVFTNTDFTNANNIVK